MMYAASPWRGTRRGANGLSANGFAANVISFDGCAFWVLLLSYSCLSKSARAYLFPQSVKHDYFCSGPIIADPIRPQLHMYIYIYMYLSLSIYIYMYLYTCVYVYVYIYIYIYT